MGVARECGKVKATHENVGCKPPSHVADTLVRAPADQHLFAVFFYEQILLVAKILRLAAGGHSTAVNGTDEFSPIAAVQRQAVVDGVCIIGENQPFTSREGRG